MTDPIRAFERLQAVNPAPTTKVLDRPDAATFLATLEDAAQTAAPIPVRQPRRRAWIVAAAAFAATLLLGVGLWLGSLLTPETEVVEPPPSTTTAPPPTTTSTTTTSSTTTTTAAPVIDADSLAGIDRFVETYNAGDVNAFMAFLAPDFTREWVQNGEVFPQTLDEVRTLYEIDVALNTVLTISDCELRAGNVVCATSKFSDLNRVLGNPARSDWDFRPVFEDGLLSTWGEARDNRDTRYRDQIDEFTTWVLENRPEFGELRPIIPLDWVIRDGIAAEIAALVAEWAASLGVALEPPPVIDAEAQALLDRFEDTFNSGDADAFMALFQPGFSREVVVEADRRLYSLEYMRDIHLVEAALNTEIRLECTSTQDLFSCVPYRYDDLHRILGIEATEDYAWNLRFDEAGLVRGWNERRENIRDIDNYEREVLSVFNPWVRENHPDIGDLRPVVAGEWIVSKRDDIVAMVQAFAESRDVTLGG